MPQSIEVMTVEFDSTKPPYKQPKRQAESSEEQPQEVPELREISPEELKHILEEHRKGVVSEWEEGEPANLKEADLLLANLQRAHLGGANLQGALLGGANLQGAYLEDANLQEAALGSASLEEANLRGANLQEANLDGANLQEAFLDGASLQGAHLDGANLQGAYLRGANLQEAFLVGASLQKAHLDGANLQEAHLGQATLQKARFKDAILREVIFQDADLTGATGLLANQFAGANVSGATLPEKIDKFEGLGQVEKISQRAQKLFLSILLGCVYCWLTIATTTDVALITNSGSSPLPIIQTKIPIAYFYWAAPLILLSLYFWFHLYLQRLWERLSQLPAVFTDGEALDEKVYPWLISGMVCSHVRLLKAHRPALSRIQTGISILLAWWLVPFTFLFFWLRYIPRHDWVGTSLHLGVLAVSITSAMFLHRLAAKTLRGERTSSLSWKEKAKSLPAYQHCSLTLGILGLWCLVFFAISAWTLDGVRPSDSVNSWKDLFNSPPTEISLDDWHDGPILFPRLFDYFGYRTYANLEEVDISTKEATWTGQKEKLKDEIPLVKGVKLKSANLQNANMVRAFLVNADLRFAQIQGADLSGANLQRADLRFAQIQGADLSGANLQRADLSGAILHEADLRGAILHEANLRGADLQKANLRDAKLQEANLRDAKLQKANLVSAQLSSAKLIRANLAEANLWRVNLAGANLNTAYLREANLRYAYLPEADLGAAYLREANLSGAILHEADLRGATLQKANLRGADLQKADLRDAKLQEADLRGAILTDVKNLTQAQLNQACVNESTILPEGLTRPKPCPEEAFSQSEGGVR